MLNADTTNVPASADSGVSQVPASPTRLRLWLVDDNDRLRQTVVELLAHMEGIECDRDFSSATAAISALASRSGPDVILLDIQMGRENGLDAVRTIKSLSRNTRVFMFTTVADHRSRQRAMENGASGFLLKRYPIEAIVRTIREPGEFDGLTIPRRSVNFPSDPAAKCLSDKQPHSAETLSFPVRKHDVLRRCLGVLKSFWN